MIGPEPAAQRGYGLIRCHSGLERHSKVYERLEIDRFLVTVTCTSSMPIVWADCIRGIPCVYGKPKHEHIGDAVRPEWRVNK
jgi:hypothetical protein